MYENYIVINGKKAELTEEQLKQLGIEVELKRNNPFGRVKNDEIYYYFESTDVIGSSPECSLGIDDNRFCASIYFNDRDFATQVMLHQRLYRKLLKYAYDHEAEDCEWNNGYNHHYYIYFHYKFNRFTIAPTALYKNFCVYFSSAKVAEQAIEDVIQPFMKEHPEFVW